MLQRWITEVCNPKISVRHSRFSYGPSWGCWGILQNGHRL